MTVLEQLASAQNIKGEQPNIDLAETLVASKNQSDIAAVVAGLTAKQKVANDCIKVLYEIGARAPELIAPYDQQFLDGLKSKNNRLVWGSMTALSEIVELQAAHIYAQVDVVLAAFESGSVITIDNGVTVLAKLSAANDSYQARLFPFLLQHLTTCRAKEVPQHAERTMIAVNANNSAEFVKVLQKRLPELSSAQQKRVNKILKNYLD